MFKIYWYMYNLWLSYLFYRYVDLIVGAPFYYDKGHGGAAYIYMNSEEVIFKLMLRIRIQN